MATFRKLPSGIWQALVKHQGVQRSKTFPKKTQAEKWAKDMEEQIIAGKYANASLLDQLTVGQLCRRYAQEVLEIRETVVKKHRAKALEVGMGEQPLSALTPLAVVKWAEERLRTVSSDAVRRELTVLAGACEHGRLFWGLSSLENPVPEAKLLLRKKRLLTPGVQRTRRLTAYELEALLGIKTRTDTDIQPIIAFLLETALRRSELVAMRWEHVDWVRSVLRVPESKTDWKTGEEGRVVPLTPEALRILREREAQHEGKMWDIRADSVTQAFDRLCDRLKITGLRLHDLRHEATSRFFEMGLSIEEVAVITGHKDWRSLKRYTNLKPERIAKKLRGLDQTKAAQSEDTDD